MSKDEKEEEAGGARPKEELWLVGLATDLPAAARGGGQLLDHETEAPPPPCFITSLVGGKGLPDVAEGVGDGAGIEAGAGMGGGFGLNFGNGVGAGAAGVGAGTATAAAAAAAVVVVVVGTLEAALEGAVTFPLPEVCSAGGDFSRDENTLSNKRAFATNSSAET